MIPSTDVIQLTLTLKMTTAEVVETSVTDNNNSPIQNYVHPDDQTQPTFVSEHLKILGVTLDKSLLLRNIFLSSWKRGYRMTAALRRSRRFLPFETIKRLYKACQQRAIV